MRKFITSIPGTAVLTGFTNSINSALSTFASFKINMTNEEKTGMRSMSEGREGYVRLVSRIANQFPNSLSRADVPSELANLLTYYNDLEANRVALLQALEVIQETQLGAATDLMTVSDRYVQNLQISRKNEGSLDLAMKDIDEWNSRFNKNASETTTPTNTTSTPITNNTTTKPE